MIYQFVVTLKNRHTRYLDIIGFLLSALSVMFFVLEMTTTKTLSFAYLAGTIFIVGFLVWNLYQSQIKKKKVYYNRALLIAALVWMKMPYFQWLLFVFLILALLEHQAKYATEIGFGDKEIVINSFPKKRYRWTHFTNIILKDGLLTMDFANNRIFQKEVLDDEEDDAEEEEFNQFCARQLALSKKSTPVWNN